ncbi:MAG: bifunctional hydroxymethylpyrimidine kinase/phosphomethylpyrimidine kinase [Brevinematales bacterium]|nr:bifunctional hydroxymethylpyrimidine kinase/phosphomethylpyrimidine kinase [Brevinematales bacterium]
MKKEIAKVLSIAGSDPSGGAGIEADIKTLSTLKVYAMSIISSITIQNTIGVFEKFNIPSAVVEKQLSKLLEDIDFKFVKISIIGEVSNIKIFKKLLSDKFIIFDPVLYSKNGFPLIDKEYLTEVINELLPICKYITPNFHELKILSEIEESPIFMAKNILEKFKNLEAILIKGGHINEEKSIIYDTLVQRTGKIKTFSHLRIKTPNLHGTGCTLSSAIAAYLAKGYGIDTATSKAIKYLQKIIKKSSNIKFGKGTGPLIHYL